VCVLCAYVFVWFQFVIFTDLNFK